MWRPYNNPGITNDAVGAELLPGEVNLDPAKEAVPIVNLVFLPSAGDLRY